uniref:Serpentine receptor class gamma n=1 Tax=Strongyloides papillosus TaxID=174720 RepID=A0A0N5B930_STREA
MVSAIFVSEIIQLIYKIPSVLLMILSIYVILKEIKKKNVHFNNQFYFIIVCKLVNEINFIITQYILFKLPIFGFLNNFLEENDWTARLFFVLAAQQTSFMFLITLLISINRYLAVKYPIKYKRYFSKANMIKILLFFVIISTLVGLGNIFFKAAYGIKHTFDSFVPQFTTKKVVYYKIFYTIFLYGIISIATCIFNIKATLELKKHKQIVSYYKKELIFIIYSIFIFITLSTVEFFFVIRIIDIQYGISSLYYYVFYFFNIISFDLTSFGDYYFLIFLKNEIRNTLRCCKKSTSKVSVKIVYRRQFLPNNRSMR